MSESIEEVIDLTGWIIGGLLCGLLLLGIYNFYQATKSPQHPQLTIDPIRPGEIKPENKSESFTPIEQLKLVEKLSPQPEAPEETQNDARTDKDNPQTQDQPGVPVTDLPYELVGTTTGSSNYQIAIIRNMKQQQTRTLTPGDSWNELKLVQIKDDEVQIINATTGQREKLILNPENS